jgi:DNA-binding transcriptional ArsR family regulator
LVASPAVPTRTRPNRGFRHLAISFLDERLAKALSHRLRVQILQRLTEHGAASPSELADVLEEPLGNISYHMRVLRELDCLEFVRTEPRRGALEHFYRATVPRGSATNSGGGCR